MSKTTEIELKKNKIVVSHKSIIKNQIVHLEFIPINKYQLICNKITIENKSKIININSTDFRKINIHNLVKTSIRLIDKNIELDRKTYNRNSPIYNPRIDSKDLIKRINKNGVPILLVEQNAKQALEIADKGYVLVDGANKVEGLGQDLINDRNVARMFLGSKE